MIKKDPKSSSILNRLSIGDVVTLKTNHLDKINKYDQVWLAGEPSYTNPLMVISEISINTNIEIDESTGKEKKTRNRVQYKCNYFSNRDLRFFDNWFFHEQLLKLNFSSGNAKIKIKLDQKVVFKTNQLEISKRKSFVEEVDSKRSRKSSSLLSFSSPVFIVTGFKSIEKKKPEFDSVTGEEKHIYSSKNIKIKFFNSKLDKYSEFIVPIEVVSSAEIKNIELLDTIISAKKSNQIVKLELAKSLSVSVIKSIQFTSDNYQINYSDVFNNEEYGVKLSELKNISIIGTSSFGKEKTFPLIKETDSPLGFNFSSVADGINDLRNESEKKNRDTNSPLGDYIFFLKYVNDSNQYTERYIIPLFNASVEVIVDENGEPKKIQREYIKSFCLLRRAERYFRVDRINSFSKIDNIGLVKAAFTIWKDS